MRSFLLRFMAITGLLVVTLIFAEGALADGPTDVETPGPAPRFAEKTACHQRPYVILLVDSAVKKGIATNLARFEDDLCDQGFGVITTTLDPVATPYHIRKYLAGKAAAIPVAGTILIGGVPYAYQWIDTPVSDVPYEAISFQYYSDLDGKFQISPGYVSPGGHTYSFDLHTGSTDWEIWVGVMPVYMGDTQLTIQAINRYLDKNHAYRVNGTWIPRAYMEINEHHVSESAEQDEEILGWMTTGEYAWQPMSSSSGAYLRFNSFDNDLSVFAGLYEMTEVGVADFTVYSAHGGYSGNGLHTRNFIENNPTHTIFYWAGGCAVGDLDHADNWIASAIYALESDMLLVQGSTQNSGGLGTNINGPYGENIATAMDGGAGAGDAIKAHMNAPLLWPWSDSEELHKGLLILAGDPTLTLPMGHPDITWITGG